MTRDDLIVVSKDLAATTREYVAGTIGEFIGRLKALEDRVLAVRDGEKGDKGDRGEPGIPGSDGKDAGTELLAVLKADNLSLRAELDTVREAQKSAGILTNDLRAALVEIVKGELATLPPAKDGKDGQDGTAVTIADVTPVILAEVQKAVAALPPVKDGQDGERGATGERGQDGTSVDPAAVEVLIVQHVTKAMDGIPRPQDGRSVTLEDVQPLVLAEVSKAVSAIPAPKDGTDGKDGIGMAGALIDRAGQLVVTLSTGEAKTLGPVVGEKGRDGTDGHNGQDGINLDFWTCEVTRTFDPETRMVTDRYVAGERVKELSWKQDGAPVYRGVYKAGQSYETGDIVTYGHVWIAKDATSAKPDEHTADGKRAWQMLMRRGSDGKIGPQGEPGKDGKNGLDGKDRWQP